MAEAQWDDGSKSPPIDWHMSAALENVPRGDTELAEVTSLARAVRAWLALDPAHRTQARLTPERPVLIEGVSYAEFGADGIAGLAAMLPAEPDRPNRADQPQ